MTPKHPHSGETFTLKSLTYEWAHRDPASSEKLSMHFWKLMLDKVEREFGPGVKTTKSVQYCEYRDGRPTARMFILTGVVP